MNKQQQIQYCQSKIMKYQDIAAMKDNTNLFDTATRWAIRLTDIRSNPKQKTLDQKFNPTSKRKVS